MSVLTQNQQEKITEVLVTNTTYVNNPSSIEIFLNLRTIVDPYPTTTPVTKDQNNLVDITTKYVGIKLASDKQLF